MSTGNDWAVLSICIRDHNMVMVVRADGLAFNQAKTWEGEHGSGLQGNLHIKYMIITTDF